MPDQGLWILVVVVDVVSDGPFQLFSSITRSKPTAFQAVRFSAVLD
jgi:hypothetical protein